MANTTIATEYLREAGATNDKINNFFYFCSTFKSGGKKAFYEVYRLLVRLLKHWGTPYKNIEGLISTMI